MAVVGSMTRSVYMVRKGDLFYRNHSTGFIEWTSIREGQIFHRSTGARRAANLCDGQVMKFELDPTCAVIL